MTEAIGLDICRLVNICATKSLTWMLWNEHPSLKTDPIGAMIDKLFLASSGPVKKPHQGAHIEDPIDKSLHQVRTRCNKLPVILQNLATPLTKITRAIYGVNATKKSISTSDLRPSSCQSLAKQGMRKHGTLSISRSSLSYVPGSRLHLRLCY